MSQMIGRMYSSPERAAQAVAELRDNEIRDFEDVFIISGTVGAGAPPRSTDAIMADLLAAYVVKSQARVYAQGIQRGGTLVVVHASFGTAVVAIDIMDALGPIDSGIADFSEPLRPWDEATPISCALQLPVLLPDNYTFARFWNVPPLSKKPATTFSFFGWPEVSASRGPFGGTFGMKLLSNKAAPLSSMLGLPALLQSRASKR